MPTNTRTKFLLIWLAGALLALSPAMAQQTTGTPVDDQDYQVPFAFTGTIAKITLTIERPKLTPADEKKLMEAQKDKKAGE